MSWHVLSLFTILWSRSVGGSRSVRGGQGQWGHFCHVLIWSPSVSLGEGGKVCDTGYIILLAALQEGQLDHGDIATIWKDYPAHLHSWLLRPDWGVWLDVPTGKHIQEHCPMPVAFKRTWGMWESKSWWWSFPPQYDAKPFTSEVKPVLPYTVDWEMHIIWYQMATNLWSVCNTQYKWPSDDGGHETKMLYRFDYLPAGLFNRMQVSRTWTSLVRNHNLSVSSARAQ